MADSTPLKGSVPDRMQRTQQAIKLVREIYNEIDLSKESIEATDLARAIRTLEWYYNRIGRPQDTRTASKNFRDAFTNPGQYEAPH
jgi:hypothetical protein